MLDIDVVNKFIASLSEEEIKEPELVANIAKKFLWLLDMSAMNQWQCMFLS